MEMKHIQKLLVLGVVALGVVVGMQVGRATRENNTETVVVQEMLNENVVVSEDLAGDVDNNAPLQQAVQVAPSEEAVEEAQG